MLIIPLTAKHPNNQTDTYSFSIWLEFVIDNMIAIGPDIAKRKAINPSTK